MVSDDTAVVYLLRDPARGPVNGTDASVVEKEREAQGPEEQEYILCRQCRQAVTRPAERIEVQGAHRHTFANPHGLVFEIGCFNHVVGCGYAGAASDEFTWFPGYSWKICFCALCLTHLGWIFSSPGGNAFHGLILDRLIDPTSG